MRLEATWRITSISTECLWRGIPSANSPDRWAQDKHNMNIDDLTLGQVKQIQAMAGNAAPQSGPWIIGEHYVIRTVTMIQTGVLMAVHPQELVLSDAAWIADTGRWNNFLRDPNLAEEVEPFTAQVIVGRAAIIDCQVIAKFNRTQK